jgi:hypothetical protein
LRSVPRQGIACLHASNSGGRQVRSGEEFRELGHLGGWVDHWLDEEFVDAGLFRGGDAGEEVVAGADQGQV